LDLRVVPFGAHGRRRGARDERGIPGRGTRVFDRALTRRLPGREGSMTDVPWILSCVDCSASHPGLEVRYRCECGGTLDVVHDFARLPAPVTLDTFDARRGAAQSCDRSGVWRFRELVLPLAPDEIVTRPEGNTNLYSSR